MKPCPEPFHIRKNRSLTEILMGTISYLGRNANALVLSAGILALPLILFSKAAAAYITEDSTPFHESIFHKSELSKKAFIFYCMLFSIFILGLGIYNFILNKFMAINDKSPTTLVSADLIKQDFKASFKRWFPNFLIIFIFYYGLSQVTHVLTGMQHEYNNTLDPDSDAISYYSQLAIPYLPVIAVLPFLVYLLFASLYLCYRDQTDTTATARLLMKNMRQNYKKIFLCSGAILVVAFLANYFLQKFLFVCFGIFSFLSINVSFYLLFDIIRMALGFAIVAFIQIACIILLGSMEDDAESHYIRQQMDQIQP